MAKYQHWHKHTSSTDVAGTGLTRRSLLKKAGIGIAVAASPTILSACSIADSNKPEPAGGASAAPRKGGQATMAIFGATGPVILPNFFNTNYAISVSQSCFDTLLRYDEHYNLVPWLAKSYRASPNGRTYTFKLREGVKWSDGEPFTGRDVEAAVLALTDPATVTSWISYVQEIEGALDRKSGKSKNVPGLKVIDDMTVEVTTVAPSAIFLDLFGTNFMPLPKHVVDTIPAKQLTQSKFSQQPTVSTAAFHLVKRQGNDTFVLERNPHYWGQPAYLDRVFIKVTTPEAAIAGISRGEVDVIPGEISGELPPNEVADLKSDKRITVTSYANNNTETFYMNLRTRFKDVRTREAVAYAIDRDAIVKSALLGFGKVADSVYPTYSPYYDASAIKKWNYDPAKAKRLLQEIGWDSSNSLDFLLPTGDTTRTQVGTIIQQQLAAVGLKCRIEQVDFATSVDRLVSKHKFDVSETQNRGYNNLDVSRRFACKSLNGGVNSGGYCNPHLDSLMTRAEETLSRSEQKPLVSKIQAIISEDLPTLMLYYRDSIGAVNTASLSGATPHRGGTQLDIAKWHRV